MGTFPGLAKAERILVRQSSRRMKILKSVFEESAIFTARSWKQLHYNAIEI
jgi:hypothetical protein